MRSTYPARHNDHPELPPLCPRWTTQMADTHEYQSLDHAAMRQPSALDRDRPGFDKQSAGAACLPISACPASACPLRARGL